MRGPRRIVCLTAETVDTLYRLGAQDRIVGITGFATHPPEARRDKPRIAAYTSARLDRILALRPDLVLAYSDLQATLAHDLIRAGIEVYVFNQRDIAGILEMIHRLGSLVDAKAEATRLIDELQGGLEQTRQASRQREAHRPRPRVYFEEWPDPMITAIRWVSELIEIAGGTDIFAARSHGQAASARIIADSDLVLEAKPDVIIGSWCGRRFQPRQFAERRGWHDLLALRHAQVHEIKSAVILQPGPQALSVGLQELQAILDRAQTS